MSGARWLEPVALGGNLPSHLADAVQAVRSNKSARRLAVKVKHQLRHLIDVAALEALLSAATVKSLELGISPIEWLESQAKALEQEHAATAEEHQAMAARIAGLQGGRRAGLNMAEAVARAAGVFA